MDPVESNPLAPFPFVRAEGDIPNEEGVAEAFHAIVAQASTTVKVTLGVVGGAPKVTLHVISVAPTIPPQASAFGSLLELVDEEEAKYHVDHHGVCAVVAQILCAHAYSSDVRMLTLSMQVILSTASSRPLSSTQTP